MSFMFEVYYRPPANPGRETAITERVVNRGGRLDYREDAHADGSSGICLTFEFDDFDAAQRTAEELRHLAEHVEGPVDYGG